MARLTTPAFLCEHLFNIEEIRSIPSSFERYLYVTDPLWLALYRALFNDRSIDTE